MRVLHEYEDVDGVVRQADPDALAAVLEVLGEPEPVAPEPVTVAWDGRMAPPEGGRAHLTLEGGDELEWDGADALPLGVHTLHAETGDTTVISAPRRCHEAGGRRRGVFAPLYALHSSDSWGAGNLGDLDTLAEWVASRGGDVVATLPLLATFLGETGGTVEPSPYAPVSRLFWNELYLQVDAPPETNVTPAPLRDLPEVDHHQQAVLQRRVLEPVCEWLPPHGDLRPDLLDYARFRAAGELHGTDWTRWPARLRDGDVRDEDVDPAAVRYHVGVQRLFEDQLDALRARLRRRGVELLLDLPVGTHPHGYDAWRHRDQLANGVSAGAPPDDFFRGGQCWGFAPLHPRASRRHGHAYFRAALAHHLAAADVLRVDHVMGLHRMFWVPDGFEATDGVYVTYPAEELYALLALESRRHRCRVVGEDLGTVPPEVRSAMREHGVARTWVAQFELPGGDEPPLGSFAAVDTHDTPTFAGWWEEAGPGERKALAARLGVPADDPGTVLDALLAWLGASDASVAVVSLEDLWLERRPQNVPGTSGAEHPNWRRRAALSLEEIARRPDVAARLDALVRTP